MRHPLLGDTPSLLLTLPVGLFPHRCLEPGCHLLLSMSDKCWDICVVMVRCSTRVRMLGPQDATHGGAGPGTGWDSAGGGLAGTY